MPEPCRTNLTLNARPAIITSSWNYDTASRLSEACEGTNKATYSYLANSPLVDHITFADDGTTRMVSTRQYDYLNRLTNAVSTTNPVNFVRHNYAYNTASQPAMKQSEIPPSSPPAGNPPPGIPDPSTRPDASGALASPARTVAGLNDLNSVGIRQRSQPGRTGLVASVRLETDYFFGLSVTAWM